MSFWYMIKFPGFTEPGINASLPVQNIVQIVKFLTGWSLRLSLFCGCSFDKVKLHSLVTERCYPVSSQSVEKCSCSVGLMVVLCFCIQNFTCSRPSRSCRRWRGETVLRQFDGHLWSLWSPPEWCTPGVLTWSVKTTFMAKWRCACTPNR